MTNDSHLTQLNRLVADYTVFAQLTRGFHWLVTGPMFFELHREFETLYDDAAETVDHIAERIVALGGRPVTTLKEALATAGIAEEETRQDADGMVRSTLAALEMVLGAVETAADSAEKAGDRGTTNLLDELAMRHEKHAWMLRAWLAGVRMPTSEAEPSRLRKRA